ncbi:arsenate reductase family protein [Salinicoccus halitifaciens]|uniref:Arsenate reductase n=1 Tax=Salinicoccus halitifaciens TaxID=1073415 RepID=A0ABV2ECV8_9STAP|nr:arsenate reductase family protein [Salinicoccus halitifaciens]MCD2138820.1 arsenate reductase family protein [Salinicoccus halitifaciens]
MITFYEYSKCTTCRKGKKFLEENGIEFEAHDMVKAPPSKETLKRIIEKSDHDIGKFFNTRGKKYKELDLKNRLPEMDDDEKIELLSSDGMLIKRPLVDAGDDVLLGFKESEYKETLL